MKILLRKENFLENPSEVFHGMPLQFSTGTFFFRNYFEDSFINSTSGFFRNLPEISSEIRTVISLRSPPKISAGMCINLIWYSSSETPESLALLLSEILFGES